MKKSISILLIFISAFLFQQSLVFSHTKESKNLTQSNVNKHSATCSHGNSHSSEPLKEHRHGIKDNHHEKHESKNNKAHNHGNYAHNHKQSYKRNHDEEENLNLIQLTKDQQKAANIKISKASSGILAKTINLSGEIRVNTDNQSHHIARANGICRKINFDLGDKVEKDEVLAVIDSAVLGQSKSEYYEAFNQTAISEMNLERAKNIYNNVSKLLLALSKTPENTESLQKSDLEMGEYRAKLIAAYSEYINNKKNFDRKNKLFKDKIISENDYMNSKSTFDKAKAEYFSVQDTTAYEIKQRLFAAEQTHKTDEFRMYTAEQRLRILGLNTKDIDQLKINGAVYQMECTSNSCIYTTSDNKHYHENKEKFSHIEIKAERSGTLIRRNLELGEEAENNRIIFTIADLDNVWAVLQVSSKDISSVKLGQKAVVISDEGDKTIGEVTMLSPIINEETRTAAIRVLIDNHDNRFRPGSFVTANINISAENLPIVLPKEAVQNIKGTNVVFVETDHGFEPIDVITGREDSENIEILEGLEAGTKYVSAGAFTLKSIVVTSGIDPHAGHGH